ncbi:MAG TPA: hypothetical protein PK590_07560 [Candidatus Omnitrophota bacterium]|nr:hypothetical protein [Candidatus Omnitrophota bacterium]
MKAIVLEQVDDLFSDKKKLSKIERGLRDYQWIQTRVNEVDVSADHLFQERYSVFYVMWFRPKEWKKCYFELFEQAKKMEPRPDFREILKCLNERTGKMEASFASKLVATLNPAKQIIDKYVLENFELILPPLNRVNRLEETVGVYEKLGALYNDFLKEPICGEICRRFNKSFSVSNVTQLKMIDFVLWQIRPKNTSSM